MVEQQVKVSPGPMTIEEVLTVAAGSPVELTTEAIERIERSRAVVDAAIERGDAIYGVTTGVGHARNERLPHEVLDAMQPILVEMHLGAWGDPMPTEVVRAGMAVRLCGFTRGGAGVSLAVARALAEMLNQQIHPIIPRYGSVGAGDLGQLAYLGRALLGKGDVEWRGETVAAPEAFSRAGITPVRMRPKDALAVMSSNALMIGHGATLSDAVTDLLALADVVAATSMEAIGANPSFIDSAVAGARGSDGQVETSRRLREAVAGSERTDPALASVQDPISFRVIPQVHGACRDVLARFISDLERELNATSDNPMVDVESDRILSNGNFHAMTLVATAESLNLALAHLGLLSERRCGQLWDAVISSMSGGSESAPPLEDGAPPALAGLALRYPAAARYTRLRQLAQPVSLDVPPLSLSVEDHANNGSEVLWSTRAIIEIVTEMLTVETLIAFARLSLSGPGGRLGAGAGRVVDLVDDVLGGLPQGSLPDETHARLMTELTSRLDDLTDRAR